MAYLPSSPVDLTGGCYCGAVRYSVEIPDLKDRPLVPGALETPVDRTSAHLEGHDSRPTMRDAGDGSLATNPHEGHSTTHPGSSSGPDRSSKPTRLPLIPLDHCSTCRRLLGAIVQCWIILPQTWVSWDLLLKPASSDPSADVRNTLSTPEVVYSGKHYLAAFQSTADDGTNGSVSRTFCSRCGTTFTFAFKASEGAASRSLSGTGNGEGEVGKAFPAIISLTVGSLDNESLEMVRPDRHGWWGAGIGWIKELLRKGDNGLMRHDGEDLGAIVHDEH